MCVLGVAGMREETMKLQKEREMIEKEKVKLMALTQNLKSGNNINRGYLVTSPWSFGSDTFLLTSATVRNKS